MCSTGAAEFQLPELLYKAATCISANNSNKLLLVTERSVVGYISGLIIKLKIVPPGFITILHGVIITCEFDLMKAKRKTKCC